MKKKNIVIMVIVILLVMLLFPIPMKLKDGGSIEYKALLYTITYYHTLALEESGTSYIDGIGVKILGLEIVNTTNKNEKKQPKTTEERIKLKDLKITAKNVDITKLVKFDNVVYGKSNTLIDYAGDFNTSIGKIKFLIGKEYMPELNCETNCEELLNCDILEANEKSMILNIDNVAVLFEAIN